ncbi:FtsX-like permease family protein [Clostridium sp. 19966]|uniref:FtsX-like permease family protein n=1 Tax=Clostridium sp. 19966 TaxID=2768166 RepID=UPI0028DDA815|nr:FtsX-like permease family protein [Clostridium sp. 19966]MDT8718430.1 FtsX-like permease family protein [Clostridium sp. 19966]
MKIKTLGYLSFSAIKSLIRNITVTIFSIITVSIVLFIFGLFLLYFLIIDKNSEYIFVGIPGMRAFFNLMGLITFIVTPPIGAVIISNAIKMNIFLRRSEISIMKLIGATNWFVRLPFIIEGFVIGITGAFIGNLLLFFAYSLIYSNAIRFTKEMNPIQPIFILSTMLWKFEIVGTFISSVGSTTALRKVLKREV